VFEKVLEDSNIWRMPGLASGEVGAVPTRFLASTEFDLEPQYSPDGTRILFSSNRSGAPEIWISDSNGQNEAALTSFAGPLVGSPRWSPDGRFIAFDSAAPGVVSVYVMRAQGGKPRRLTDDTASATRPSWSRDGRWIYFGSNRTGEWQIWKVQVTGGQYVQVTRTGGNEAFESLDGSYVYWAKRDDPGIWRMPGRGGEETQILNVSGASLFAIAPPGLWFFDVPASGVARLKYLDQASGRVTTFRDLPKGSQIDVDSTSLSLSPDGRWILYTQVDQSASNLMLLEGFH